jgi:hypothetical protein
MDGLRLASTEKFDLILLDVLLPGTDGFEVCRSLRRSGSKNADHSSDLQKLRKPRRSWGSNSAPTITSLSHSVLASFVRESKPLCGVLPKPMFACSVSATSKWISLDAKFKRAGKVVELSALEFKLLTAFVHSQGRVLTRDQLLDAAWGSDVSLNDRVVDNHIVSLRRKLEPVNRLTQSIS